MQPLKLHWSSYEPLATDASSDESATTDVAQGRSTLATRFVEVGYVASIFLNMLGVILLGRELYLRSTTITWRGVPPVYSPADEVVTYERRVYPSLSQRSIYHGPPDDAVDKAWDDLYRQNTHLISLSENHKLLNESALFPGYSEDYGYLITLDVYHQLHCLNMIRRHAWPERYAQLVSERYDYTSGILFDHIDHCINTLRESITCNADLTPDIWKIVPEERTSQVHFNVVHTCKNFDAVQGWKREHRSPSLVQATHLENPPPRHKVTWEELVKGGLAYIPSTST